MKPFLEKTVACVEALPDIKSGKILDVGCGTGWVLQTLDGKGYDIRGCDVVKNAGIKGIPVDEVDLNASPLPYEDNSYDVIIFNEVIQYIHNPLALFEEFSRVSKPGGHLVMTLPNTLHFQSRLKFMLQGYPEFFKPFFDVPKDEVQRRLLGVTPVSYVQVQYWLDCFDWEVKDLGRSRSKSSLIIFYPIIALWCLISKLTIATGSPNKATIKSRLNSWDMLSSEGIYVVARKIS